MIKSNLGLFEQRVTMANCITESDVQLLHRLVLEDGLISRKDVETLLTLDRSLPSGESWGDALVALVVDHVVWGARPTGVVTGEDARWLAAVLEFNGPTERAMRIAYRVVEESETTDEALLEFILRSRQHVQKTLAA
jgi:hypothetical protein